MKLTTVALALVLSTTALGMRAMPEIERLDLDTMVARTDGCVLGKITARRAFRVDSPVDGDELYFTALTIDGVSVPDGKPIVVEVIHLGGFVSEDDGVWNSEAPTEEETRVGRRVLAFYKWIDDIGGGVRGNKLYAEHGGLYRTFQSGSKTIVQGRGEAYALRQNLSSTDLAKRVAAARAKKKAGGK